MKRKFFENQRLLKLADYLENNVKDERFDLEVIAITETCELPSQTSCGTAACAIGHMPQIFPRLCKYSEIDLELCKDEYGPGNPYWLEVEGKGELSNLNDFKLAEELFGINEYEALYLFMPDSYNIRKGRKTVAKRIRKFVEEGRIPKDHDLYYNAYTRFYQYKDSIEEAEELEKKEYSEVFNC